MAKKAPPRKPPRMPTLVFRPKGTKGTSRQQEVKKGK